jgi:hypothetical protein
MCCDRYIFVVFLEGGCGKVLREIFAGIIGVIGSGFPSLRLCDLCFESIEWE